MGTEGTVVTQGSIVIVSPWHFYFRTLLHRTRAEFNGPPLDCTGCQSNLIFRRIGRTIDQLLHGLEEGIRGPVIVTGPVKLQKKFGLTGRLEEFFTGIKRDHFVPGPMTLQQRT